MLASTPLLVLVGLGPGLGLSLARRWGREGYRLALIGHDAAPLAAITDSLRSEGITAQAYPAHVGDQDALRTIFQAIQADFGDAETLIYNASVSHEAPVSALLPATLEADLRANVSGLLLAIQAVLPAMQAAGKGSVLLTGGGSALKPSATGASLGVGKAAQRSLLRSLAQELDGLGIRVATLTIRGFIERGGPFDPDALAQQMWELHSQDLAHPEIERIVG